MIEETSIYTTWIIDSHGSWFMFEEFKDKYVVSIIDYKCNTISTFECNKPNHLNKLIKEFLNQFLTTVIEKLKDEQEIIVKVV